MIKYTEDPAHQIATIVIDGKVTEDDFERIAPQLEKFIATHGKVKLLEEIRNLGGFDFGVIGEGIKFDRKHLKNFSHCAVVSDKGWIGPFARIAGTFIKCEIRTFRPNEIDEARSWLESV